MLPPTPDYSAALFGLQEAAEKHGKKDLNQRTQSEEHRGHGEVFAKTHRLRSLGPALERRTSG